jgi:flavin reductase (DIM6/NTAB) family NADH-FMN oxidoreductase RutF
MIIDPRTVSSIANYRLLSGAVIPRPIAFVSTISPGGVRNLAPFSFFNAVCSEPPVVSFCPTVREPLKDTLANVLATREFVVNIVNEAIAAQMNICAAEFPADVDEFEVSGLTAVASDVVKPPRVLESPVSMECRLIEVVDVSRLPRGASLVLGEVVRFHVDDRVVSNDVIDPDKLRAVGRMSANSYVRTRDRFELIRPV